MLSSKPRHMQTQYVALILKYIRIPIIAWDLWCLDKTSIEHIVYHVFEKYLSEMFFSFLPENEIPQFHWYKFMVSLFINKLGRIKPYCSLWTSKAPENRLLQFYAVIRETFHNIYFIVRLIMHLFWNAYIWKSNS